MSASSSVSISAKGLRVTALIIWVLVTFIGAQFIAAYGFVLVAKLVPAVAALNPSIQTTIIAAISYIVAFLVAALVPITIGGKIPFKRLLGVDDLPSWGNIGAALLAIFPYLILTSVAALLLAKFIPGFDVEAPQDIPFQNLSLKVEYMVAFLTLVILAPLAEELLFRGYLLGRMKLVINQWVAVFITALVFGALHLPGAVTDSGITLQWAVAVDTFVLGTVLGSLRILTKNVWASVLLHMIKNGVAFFALFIYPLLTGTM